MLILDYTNSKKLQEKIEFKTSKVHPDGLFILNVQSMKCDLNTSILTMKHTYEMSS